jgi:ComF family protein
MVYIWTKTLHRMLFPSSCSLCRAPAPAGLELCADCHAELPWVSHCCTRCALPLPPEASPRLCKKCVSSPPAIDSCHALFDYRAPVDNWIQALKFAHDLAGARLLGELLAAKLVTDEQARTATLVPVPLHRKRLAQRGYNQSREILRVLSDKGFRLDPYCCRRHKRTDPQSDLPAGARVGNVRDAFFVSRVPEGGRVLLVDDVMTTGATLNELARTLKKAGAHWVGAWVIARTTCRRVERTL